MRWGHYITGSATVWREPETQGEGKEREGGKTGKGKREGECKREEVGGLKEGGRVWRGFWRDRKSVV